MNPMKLKYLPMNVLEKWMRSSVLLRSTISRKSWRAISSRAITSFLTTVRSKQYKSKLIQLLLLCFQGSAMCTLLSLCLTGSFRFISFDSFVGWSEMTFFCFCFLTEKKTVVVKRKEGNNTILATFWTFLTTND